jgi:hypothetical protein
LSTALVKGFLKRLANTNPVLATREVKLYCVDSSIKMYLWPLVLGETIVAAVYIVTSLWLVVGVLCRKRALMLPYLILQVTLDSLGHLFTFMAQLQRFASLHDLIN